MTENLNKKPPKGILKSSSSFDTASCSGSGGSAAAGVRRNSGVAGHSIVGGGGVGEHHNCSRQGSNELTVEGGVGIGTTTAIVDQGVVDCCGGGGGDGDNNGEGYVVVRKHSKTAKFDEMNILETYHPATKTYGHMKIEEPKTPFNYYEDDEVDVECGGEGASSSSQGLSSSSSSKRRSKEINADELLRKLNECKGDQESLGGGAAGGVQDEEESSEEDGDEDDESRASRVKFESKRKAHYNEYYAVKLARKLMEQEEDEDDDDDKDRDDDDDEESEPGKFIPVEETGVLLCGVTNTCTSTTTTVERDNETMMEEDG